MQRINSIIENSAAVWGVTFAEAENLLAINHQKAVRVNPLNAKKSTITNIKKLSVDLKAISWCKDAYTATGAYAELSKTKMFASGEYILQDPASFVPVLALDPKPGDKILDMCAAPGSKTTHIAAITNNRADIVANDTSRTRFFKMKDMFKRYGVRAELTLQDGRSIKGTQLYDKILLDTPCSGEAAVSPTNPKTFATWSTAKVKRLSRLQKQLILSAYDSLKPGGTLVYSTCTINASENELVVNYLLKRRPADICNIDIDVGDTQQGIEHWNNKTLDPRVGKTLRLLPNDMHEAFYCAKIQKPLKGNEPEDEYRL